MGTQLVLTVGTNALPVWVAWHHLKDNLCGPVQVRLVHTAKTTGQSDRLRTKCTDADFLDPLKTSAGDPQSVSRDIGGVLCEFPEGTTLHVHYTGGTKVMGVETVSAVEAKNVTLETSYLDPRGADGPTIVSRAGTLVDDARIGICPDLKLIAYLNGFELGPFEYRYWQGGGLQTQQCPAPGIPTAEQLQQGGNWLDNRWPRCTNADKFLEYAVYAVLSDVLERICDNNARRCNHRVFHDVYVRRQRGSKPFQLDVVAVLGYQIVVVSCTLDGRRDQELQDGLQSAIKKKGMEAILRARQLGGDEARAIVLCSATQAETELIQSELHDEIGSSAPPLEIWGKNSRGNLPTMQALSDKFRAYLKDDMKWS